MPLPTYAQLITLSSSAAGLVPEALQERLLTVLAMLASGTGPDGTALPGGPSGAIPSAHAQRTAGDVSVSSTSFVEVDTAIRVTVAAAVGDVLEFTYAGMGAGDGTNVLELNAATVVGGALTNFASGNNTSWLSNVVATPLTTLSFTVQYTVVSGDISSGNVTMNLVARMSAGTGTISANASRVTAISVKNLKH